MGHQYQSLIIFLNRRCPVGCASCNAKALPGNREELTGRWLSAFFRIIKKVEFPGFVLWTGGEPFLSFEALQAGIAIASGQGFHSEILTSGTWFDTHPQRLEPLAGKSNISLRISLDAEHQETVLLELVIALIRKAWALQIEVNFTLRDIPGREGFADRCIGEIKNHLPEFYRRNRSRSRWLHRIPHMPVSPAPANPCVSQTQKYRQPCPMIFRDLVIGEDGLVYPCCGFLGFPFHQQLAVGNPMEESWESLVSRQKSHPLFRMLQEKGPYGICRKLGLEPGRWKWPPFQSPCHLCMALFNEEGETLIHHPFFRENLR